MVPSVLRVTNMVSYLPSYHFPMLLIIATRIHRLFQNESWHSTVCLHK